MRSIFNYIIKPKEKRTESIRDIDGKELILNTDLQNHMYVSRVGVVVGLPSNAETLLKEGDEIIVHHNVFRRFKDIRGKEKNSKSYIKDNLFVATDSEIYMYKRDGEQWRPLSGYCYVKPVHEERMFNSNVEQVGVGVAKYVSEELNSDGINVGDLIGFRPGSEYEFIINKEKLYRVKSNFITCNYGDEYNKKEYHPSWLQSN